MLSFKEITILSGEQVKNRKLCKVCGHSRLLGNQDKIICNHCGHYIFKDDAAEFNYRLKQRLIKQKHDNLTN